MFNLIQTAATSGLLVLVAIVSIAQSKSYPAAAANQQYYNEELAVIPSPNENDQVTDDIQRVGVNTNNQLQQQQQQQHQPATQEYQAAPSETAVPVYVSPFLRPERAATSNIASLFDSPSESSHAPPNYAPKPPTAASSSSPVQTTRDLKAAASYGHHDHGGYGHDSSGWLDMGAWTGGKGSFGWYADYPVGSHGKHHYGRK